MRRHGFHFLRNRRIIVRQIGMGSLGVGDAQIIAGLGEIEIDPLNGRILGVLEIHMAETAHGAGHLVH